MSEPTAPSVSGLVERALAELELVRGHHRPDICYEQGCYACRAYWSAMDLASTLEAYERALRDIEQTAFSEPDEYMTPVRHSIWTKARAVLSSSRSSETAEFASRQSRDGVSGATAALHRDERGAE